MNLLCTEAKNKGKERATLAPSKIFGKKKKSEFKKRGSISDVSKVLFNF
jgi:hypothetical protein